MPYSCILLSVSKLLQFAGSLLLNSDRVEHSFTFTSNEVEFVCFFLTSLLEYNCFTMVC